MIFHGLAAIRAINGEEYNYPLVADLARKLM
jgi:hypothetical protein